ncbi:MAG: DUF721 domain-containing protein [Bacteroidota bacterium]
MQIHTPSSDATPIQDVIRKMLAQSPHQRQLTAAALSNAWKAIMPAAVCRRTERIFVRDGQLFIQLNSSSLKHTLQLRKDQVLQRLAAEHPHFTIKDLVFL